MNFMLITNDTEVARHAEKSGVARIFVDLEQHGKKERQGHLDTLISQHCMADVSKVKQSMQQAELLVRLNPFHSGSQLEVDDAIAGGADLLMLPMFHSAEEVQQFSTMVDGRAGVIPLVETHAAAKAIQQIVKVAGISEIYIGLNDLHLDMKLDFMFEPLANGFVDEMAEIIKAAGLHFGFGGIARVGEGIIPGEMVLGEHLRLGSSAVILSRTFHRKSEAFSEFKDNINLELEIKKLLAEAEKLALRSSQEILNDRQKFITAVQDFVARKKS